jgi:hypothetical protein
MAKQVLLDSLARTARMASMAKQVLLDSLARTARMASMAKQVPLDSLARTARMASTAKQVQLDLPARTASMVKRVPLVPLVLREIGDRRDPTYEQDPATSQHCFSYPRARGSTMQSFDASGTLLNCLLPDFEARRGSMRSSVKCLLGFDLRITRVYAQRIPISSRYL